MNSFEIIKQQGGVPKALPGEDHISGLLFYMADDNLPSGFTSANRVKGVSTVAAAEALGITADAELWLHRVMHYHISEAIRQNDGILLYVGCYATPAGTYNYAEIAQMQNATDGKMRQVGVWCGDKVLTSADITALQTVATGLQNQYKNLSIVITGKVANINNMPNVSGSGRCNVSVEVGQDGEGLGATLYNDADNTSTNTVGLTGLVIGMISKAAVNESIAYVAKFASGIDVPAFGDGSLVRNADATLLADLDSKRYIFLLKQTGLTDSYMSDSHTMDLLTSDYAEIELERAIDKAIRGIHLYLLPYLSSPVYVNPNDGTLRADTVAVLKNEAGRVLEQMEQAGELSGYVVEIDPAQNVLATSTIEIVVRNVAVGVLRHIQVKIGYTTQI